MKPVVVVMAIALAPNVARAQPTDPVDAEPARDGVIIGVAAGVALLARYIPDRDRGEWRGELFGGVDGQVKAWFSQRAARMSDVGLGVSVALPAAFAIGSTFDESAGDRALVYAQSLAGTLVVTSLTKALVGRPRPYVYNRDPTVRKYAAGERDAYHSFFSGHAATSFASAAAGGALYATRESDVRARALVWGASFASAAMTADLRVRAGHHFYSDVVVGALVGTGIGTLVPMLHQDTRRAPTGLELGAIAGGLIVGVTFAELVPVDSGAGLVPLIIDGGGGLAIAGTLR